jgi:hypothetical protein
VLVDAVEVGFLGGVGQFAMLDLFPDVAVDESLEGDSFSQGQAVVDLESQALGCAVWLPFAKDSPRLFPE